MFWSHTGEPWASAWRKRTKIIMFYTIRTSTLEASVKERTQGPGEGGGWREVRGTEVRTSHFPDEKDPRTRWYIKISNFFFQLQSYSTSSWDKHPVDPWGFRRVRVQTEWDCTVLDCTGWVWIADSKPESQAIWRVKHKKRHNHLLLMDKRIITCSSLMRHYKIWASTLRAVN